MNLVVLVSLLVALISCGSSESGTHVVLHNDTIAVKHIDSHAMIAYLWTQGNIVGRDKDLQQHVIEIVKQGDAVLLRSGDQVRIVGSGRNMHEEMIVVTSGRHRGFTGYIVNDPQEGGPVIRMK